MPGLWKEAYKTKKGLRYRIRQQDEEGKRKDLKTKFSHANPANTYIDKITDTQGLGKPVQEAIRVSEAIILYLAHRKTLIHTPEKRKIIEASTYRINEDALEEFRVKFGNSLLTEIDNTKLEAFKNEMITRRAPSGINVDIRNIRQFFNFCVTSGWLTANPAKTVKEFDPKKIKAYRFLTRKELAHFMKSGGDREWFPRAVYVLYNMGFRAGEFLRMKWTDLEADGISTTNKGKTRFIPIRSGLVRKRITYFIENPLNRNTFYSGWNEAVKTAKMGRVRPHDMRHTWASTLVQNGWPRKAIMDMGGWSSSEMLDIYTHFEREFFVENMKKFRIRKDVNIGKDYGENYGEIKTTEAK